LRQIAHLGRDYGKAAPLFTRPGRFHRGIQGQDIGLERDAVEWITSLSLNCHRNVIHIDPPHD
jgi:hypothetical protein